MRYFSILILFLSGNVFGQLVNGGSGHLSIGNAWLNSSHIGEIVPNGLIPSSSLFIGGGGHGVFNGFLIGGEGGAMLSGVISNETHAANQTSVYGMFDFGYAHAWKEAMVFYPVVGVGRGMSILNYDNSMGDESRYQTNRMFLKFELNLDLFGLFRKETSDRFGFKTGISLGYLMNPMSEQWTNFSGSQLFVPRNSLEGVYLKLKFGGGGFSVK